MSESESIIEQLRYALLIIAETYEDKALFAKKLAHHLDNTRVDILQDFLTEINELLKTEIAFDEKWIGKLTNKKAPT